ncbi:EipB family protein [Candidatus Finniella inopinata]|uniref:EipB family protein n=1 Tax=Candidatus Finniella inopinata TaxID=1696036 RepID=UPI0013EEC258|nr:DUF1849 family protein [Candidatus Finniella inopinata]
MLKIPLILFATLTCALGNIVPHKASYTIALSKPAKGQESSVTGSMTMDIRDTGAGWTFEQQFMVSVNNFTDKADEFRTTIASWESKDGKYYIFTTTSSHNGRIVDYTHGHATTDPFDPGMAVYQQPKACLVRLNPGTLFPLHYLNKILQTIEKVIEKEALNLSNQAVFDGTYSTQDAVEKVNVIMTPLTPALVLNNKDLIDADKAWSLHMAFFQPDSKEIDPDFEMTQTILKSGIILSMEVPMEYGEKTLQTTMTLKDVTIYSH